MLCAAETGEPAVDHDGESGAQRLALLHAVRGEHDGAALPDGPQNALPQKAARGRVHAARRLVQENERRVADQRDCCRQLSFVAT